MVHRRFHRVRERAEAAILASVLTVKLEIVIQSILEE